MKASWISVRFRINIVTHLFRWLWPNSLKVMETDLIRIYMMLWLLYSKYVGSVCICENKKCWSSVCISMSLSLCLHRTAEDRVRVGEQLHPQDVPFSVCQPQQFYFLHRLLFGKVRQTSCRSHECSTSHCRSDTFVHLVFPFSDPRTWRCPRRQKTLAPLFIILWVRISQVWKVITMAAIFIFHHKDRNVNGKNMALTFKSILQVTGFSIGVICVI